MEFKLGEKVVYPNHGVGLIEQISFGYVNGKSERFYMLRIAVQWLESYGAPIERRERGTQARYPLHTSRRSSLLSGEGPLRLPTTIGSIASRKIQTGCVRDR